MSFYYKYLLQCKKIGKSPSAAAVEAGFTKTSVHKWKNGSTPTDATILDLSLFFGCNIEDLMPDEEKPAAEDGDGLTETQRELIAAVKRLSEPAAVALLAVARQLEAAHTVPGAG